MITLATLDKATEQEVFNQAVTHMLTQNRKSLERNRCVYRTGDGLKCAAGCFISNDEYKYEFEGERWSTLVDNKSVPETHSYLIGELQLIHDGKDVCDWPIALQKLSEAMDLQFNPPSNG